MRASADDAARLLAEGKAVYASGERMAALKLFERALATTAPSLETRRELLYSSGCCHAAFGDIEAAWQFLRDATDLGLDFNAAEGQPGLMRMEASAQMRIQLRKYAAGQLKSSGTYAKEAFARSRGSTGVTLGAPRRSAASSPLEDLELAPGTGEGFGEIAGRVLALLGVGVVAAVLLFRAGLSSLR